MQFTWEAGWEKSPWFQLPGKSRGFLVSFEDAPAAWRHGRVVTYWRHSPHVVLASLLLVELLATESLRGGMRSFILSRLFASSNPLILWVGENPVKAATKREKHRLILFKMIYPRPEKCCDWKDFSKSHILRLSVAAAQQLVGSGRCSDTTAKYEFHFEALSCENNDSEWNGMLRCFSSEDWYCTLKTTYCRGYNTGLSAWHAAPRNCPLHTWIVWWKLPSRASMHIASKLSLMTTSFPMHRNRTPGTPNMLPRTFSWFFVQMRPH